METTGNPKKHLDNTDCNLLVRKHVLMLQVKEIAEKIDGVEKRLANYKDCRCLSISGLINEGHYEGQYEGVSWRDSICPAQASAKANACSCLNCSEVAALFRRIKILNSAWETMLLRVLVDYYVEIRDPKLPYSYTSDALILYKKDDGRMVCLCVDEMLKMFQAAHPEHAYMYETFDCLRELYVTYELFEDFFSMHQDCLETIAAMKWRNGYYRYCPDRDDEKIHYAWLNEDSKKILRDVIKSTRYRVDNHFQSRHLSGQSNSV